MLGKKHNLETIDIFNEDATVAPVAGMYVGMDRFDTRKAIVEDLRNAGLLEKEEDYTNNIGLSERTKVPVEPRLSLQWFVKMQHFADESLAPVMDDIIRFVPENTRPLTESGSRTFRTGASAASSGGDTAYPLTSTATRKVKTKNSLWPSLPKKLLRKHDVRAETPTCSPKTSVRTPMLSTHGSRRGFGLLLSSTASTIQAMKK